MLSTRSAVTRSRCAITSGLQRAEGLPVDQSADERSAALLEIAREELVYHAALIETQMEEWGFYLGADYYVTNPDARIGGDPRNEWICGEEAR